MHAIRHRVITPHPSVTPPAENSGPGPSDRQLCAAGNRDVFEKGTPTRASKVEGHADLPAAFYVSLYAPEVPQVFDAKAIAMALHKSDYSCGTDEAGLMAALGDPSKAAQPSYRGYSTEKFAEIEREYAKIGSYQSIQALLLGELNENEIAPALALTPIPDAKKLDLLFEYSHRHALAFMNGLTDEALVSLAKTHPKGERYVEDYVELWNTPDADAVTSRLNRLL